VVDVIETNAGRRQTVANRVGGKIGVALLARKALLLPGGDDLAISQQAGCAIVIESGNAENVGRTLTRQANLLNVGN
jgi:hypothetical protein